MMINEELEWIINKLNECGIRYWIDSGTLLGIVREGQLLSHDKDIDISIFDEDETKLSVFSEEIQKVGYSLRVLSYNNLNFKYKFKPFNGGSYIIDINIFRRLNDIYWCPQPFLRHKERLIAKVINKIFLFYYYKKAKSDLAKFPTILILSCCIWKIPQKYLMTFCSYKSTDISIPEKTEAYLSFRYGNWKIPNRNWDLLRDDGGISCEEPDMLTNCHG